MQTSLAWVTNFMCLVGFTVVVKAGLWILLERAGSCCTTVSLFSLWTWCEQNVWYACFVLQVAVLGLLSSEQKAQFILQPDSGVLGNDSVFREVFSSVITSLDLNQLGGFFTAFNQTAIQVRISVVYKPGHIFLRNNIHWILCILFDEDQVCRDC